MNVICTLPWPPSANHAWRSFGGRVLVSEQYRSYKKAVGEAVLVNRVKRHWTLDRLAVGVRLFPPNRVSIDIDNRMKTAIDSLVGAGVIADDKYIDILLVQRAEIVAGGVILVRIEELSSLPNDFTVDSWFKVDSVDIHHLMPKIPGLVAGHRGSIAVVDDHV